MLTSFVLPPSAFFRPFFRPACPALARKLSFNVSHFRTFSAFTMAPTSASEVPKWVDDLVDGHKIMVFSKRYVQRVSDCSLEPSEISTVSLLL